MTDKELLSRIKSNNLGGVYLFVGEEDYLKRHYLGELRRAAVTDETFSFFNHLILDGKEGSFAEVIDAMKAPPMMEDFKLIEWRYPLIGSMKEEELLALESLADMCLEYPYAVVAMIVAEGEVDLGTEKRPSKFKKRFDKILNILNFPRSSDSDLLSWLKRHFTAEGIAVTRESLEALISRSGRSMDVLKLEVLKLSSYLHAKERCELTPEDVAEVASSSPESDTYALSNAIIDRNKKGAYLALAELKKNRTDPLIVMGMISRTYTELVSVVLMMRDGLGKEVIAEKTKLHPYRVSAYMKAAKLFRAPSPVSILEELVRVDVGSKWGGVSGYTAIELFIAKCV